MLDAHRLERPLTVETEPKRRAERAKEARQLAKAMAEAKAANRKVERLRETFAARENEDPAHRAKRDARNARRETLADIRECLTGERREAKARGVPIYEVWHFVFERWRKAGEPREGVEIPFERIQSHLTKHVARKGTHRERDGYSARQIRELVRDAVESGVIAVRDNGPNPRVFTPQMVDGFVKFPNRSARLESRKWDRFLKSQGGSSKRENAKKGGSSRVAVMRPRTATVKSCKALSHNGFGLMPARGFRR